MQTKTDIENLLRPRLVQDAEKLYPKGTYVYDILRVAYITGRTEQLEKDLGTDGFIEWVAKNQFHKYEGGFWARDNEEKFNNLFELYIEWQKLETK